MNCKNCTKYFNCEFALISYIQKIFMANALQFFRAPFEVARRKNKILIFCLKYKPDEMEGNEWLRVKMPLQ